MTLLVLAPDLSMAQALSPMSETVRTYTDRFALQLIAYNPYDTAQRFAVSIADADGAPVDDVHATAPHIQLPAGESGGFFVWGAARDERRLMVCITSQAFSTGAGAEVRGEVCGKYRITPLRR